MHDDVIFPSMQNVGFKLQHIVLLGDSIKYKLCAINVAPARQRCNSYSTLQQATQFGSQARHGLSLVAADTTIRPPSHCHIELLRSLAKAACPRLLLHPALQRC
jgi:hypothetical protein